MCTEQNGRSYAFLSWSLVPDSVEAREFYNVTDTLGPIIAELRETRPHADKIILALHAGNEFVGQPSQDFQRQCHELIDAGADVILGNHPHVLQPIERYKQGLIAYSLGNFVFCSWSLPCRTGMVLGVSVDDAQWTGLFLLRDRSADLCSNPDKRRGAHQGPHSACELAKAPFLRSLFARGAEASRRIPALNAGACPEKPLSHEMAF